MTMFTAAFHTVYSPDDGGYYVEIYDENTGKEMHTTDVYPDPETAIIAARKWMKDFNNGRVSD